MHLLALVDVPKHYIVEFLAGVGFGGGDGLFCINAGAAPRPEVGGCEQQVSPLEAWHMVTVELYGFVGMHPHRGLQS